MLACGEHVRPVYMMAGSMKQESRGFSHVRFKEYVMSEEGTAFLKEFEKENSSWTEEIKKMKASPDMFCLLPEDAGDESLDDF